MNSIKPFSPRKWLVPTIRNISVLGEDIPDVSAVFRDEELTYKQESEITGDILLTLLEAMKQFRASSGGSVSISSNTSVIRNNICTIVNNFRSAADSSGSVNLSLLFKNISEVFSAETPSRESTEELINRLSQQIGKLGLSSAKRKASVSELRGSGAFSTYAEQSAAKILKKNDNLTAILSYSDGIRVLIDKQPQNAVRVEPKADDKAVDTTTVVQNNSKKNLVNASDSGKKLPFPQTAPEVIGEKPQIFKGFVNNNLYWIPPAEKTEDAGGKDMTPKNYLVISMLDKAVSDSVKSTLFRGLTMTNTVKNSTEKTEQFVGSVNNISVINHTSAISANFVNVDFAFEFQNITKNYRKLVDLFGLTNAPGVFRLSNGSVTNTDKLFFADIGDNSAASVYRELFFRDRTAKELRASGLTEAESLKPEQAAKGFSKSDRAAYNPAAIEPNKPNQSAQAIHKSDRAAYNPAANEPTKPEQAAQESHKSDRDTEEPRTVSAGFIADEAAGAALSELIRHNIYYFKDTNHFLTDSVKPAYKERRSASLESERIVRTVSTDSDKYPESVSRESSGAARNSHNSDGKSRSSWFEKIREAVLGHQQNVFDYNESSGHSKAVRPTLAAHTERSDKTPSVGKHTAEHTNGQNGKTNENTVKIENSIEIHGPSEKLTASEYGEPARVRKFAFNITESSDSVGLFDADTSYFRIYASNFSGSITSKNNDVITGEAPKIKAAGNNSLNTAEFILLNSYRNESAKTYADFATEQRYSYAASEYVYAHDADSPDNLNAAGIGKSLRNHSADLLYNRVYKAYFQSEAKGKSDSLPQRIILSEKAAVKTNRSISVKKEASEFHDRGITYVLNFSQELHRITPEVKNSGIPAITSGSLKKETRGFHDRGITYALNFSQELHRITPDAKNSGIPAITSGSSDGKSIALLFAAGIRRQELFGILSAENKSGQSFTEFHAHNTSKRGVTEFIFHVFNGTQSPEAPTTQKIPERAWLKSSAGIASVSNIIRLSEGSNSISIRERENVGSDFSLTEEPRVYRRAEINNSIIKQSVSDSYKTIFPSHDVFVRELSHSFFTERHKSFISGANRSFIKSGGWRADTKALVLKSRRNMSGAKARLFFTEHNRLMKSTDIKSNVARHFGEAEYVGSEALSFYTAVQRELTLNTQDAVSAENQPSGNSSAETPERSDELVLAVMKSTSDFTQTADTVRETNEKSDEPTLPKADEIYERLNISKSIQSLLSSEEAMKSYIHSRINSYISEANNNAEDSPAFIGRRNTEIICEQVISRLEQRLKTERRLNGR